MDEKREHNKQYLELNDEQYLRFEAFERGEIYPDSLRLFIQRRTKKVGFSGDVLVVAIADWIKQEYKEQDGG